MPFVIRLETLEGIKRLVFDSNECTYDDLLIQVEKITTIPKNKIILLRKADNSSFIKVQSYKTKLSQLNFNNGDKIYLKEQQQNKEKKKSIHF